jgi:hypothetical protein
MQFNKKKLHGFSQQSLCQLLWTEGVVLSAQQIPTAVLYENQYKINYKQVRNIAVQ